MKIAPSILSADYINMEHDVKLVEKSGADLLHIDIMDGNFVPNLSFGSGIVKALNQITTLPLDVHLMVSDPSKWIDEFSLAGADNLLVHIESDPHVYRTIQLIHSKHIKAGIVINPGTPLTLLEEYLPIVDQILIMTVNPGFGGQKFIPKMIQKISKLSNIRKESGLNFDIEVDGGINDQNIKKVADVGADIAVAGSYIFNSDPEIQIKKLRFENDTN